VWIAGVTAGAKDGVIMSVEAKRLQPGVHTAGVAAAASDGFPTFGEKEKDASFLLMQISGDGLSLRLEGARKRGGVGN